MKLETTKHALRLSHLSVAQQQRYLRSLARACRIRSKEKLLNGESQEANTYDWHRNVRLKREARACNLIRAYLKGIPYKQVEQKLRETTITPYRCFNYCSTNAVVSGEKSWEAFYKWLEAR